MFYNQVQCLKPATHCSKGLKIITTLDKKFVKSQPGEHKVHAYVV